MTLLTDTPSAGGQPPATSTPATTSSSDAAAPAPGQQQAQGKEPAAASSVPADGKAKSDNGGEAQQTDAAKTDAVKGAPEVYKFKPSPDGLAVGEGVQSALSEVARELDLTNEAAQKIVDKMAPSLRKQAETNIAAMIDGWVSETQRDPAIGGDKLNESLAYARKALDLGPPELRQLLGPPAKGGTGLGNHRAIIAWAAEIGRRLSSDAKVVSGSPVSAPPKTAIERLADTYTNSN